MRKIMFSSKWKVALALLVAIGFASCTNRASYKAVEIQGGKIAIDSVWDKNPSQAALAILAPYKAGVDSVMNKVIGYCPVTLTKGRPESPLSNLVADVLRNAAAQVLGSPADIGLVNMGGLRNILPQGDITVGTVYEILPFENSLCVVTLEGKFVKELMQNIATVQGEGISNVNLEIDKAGNVLSVKVGGQEIDDDKIYTLATIDYLADGNDGMTALMQSQSRKCPGGATLRGLFLDYVNEYTAQNKPITAVVEGRISIK